MTCVVLHVSAAEAAALEPRHRLDGLTVVVTPAAEAASALSKLASAGAEAGLAVELDEEPPLALVAQAAVLVVRGVTEDDNQIFKLRTWATVARGVRAGIRVLVEGEPVPPRALPYVDGVLQSGPSLAAPVAGDLVAASLRGGAALLLLAVRDIDWAAVADFAAQRAIGTEVTAAGTLTADEIVARHQAHRERQERLVRRTIARGTTSLLFEVPGFVAPVTVTADTVIYRAANLTEMEQSNIRVNGASVAGGSASSPPQLPLIEPERVGVPPLIIALDDRYAYELGGRERTSEGEVYVIGFAPRIGPGVRGRAWIDVDTFALRRLDTIRTGLRGPIVSSEQHEIFGRFQVDGEAVWLPVRVGVYERYEGAGHRTPVHRAIETPSYDINPPDFDARLAAAHASPHLMLRETPQGFRYLLRPGDARDGAARQVAPRAGERIRTAVFGLLVDPNITVPLPFAGFSYVDLNLFGTGAQLNLFFGGSYGQLSWSVPALGGTRWQAHGRAFAIAARFNDRSFRNGLERYEENITQRPAHVVVGLGRPFARRVRARFDYELDYTAFAEAPTTAASFVVPADSLVQGLVAALEGEWGPWSARVWWNPAMRRRWREWGSPEARNADPDSFARARTFQRFGIGAARTLALGGIVASRVEAAWMDGADLDRFSRYSFGTFENRLRGYPTASIRYDRGGVLRTSTSVSGPGFRVDMFGDVAAVRDPGFGEHLRVYPGVGAAAEAGGPFRTLWAVEWGYGFEARRSSGGTGTHAVRVTAYRTF